MAGDGVICLATACLATVVQLQKLLTLKLDTIASTPSTTYSYPGPLSSIKTASDQHQIKLERWILGDDIGIVFLVAMQPSKTVGDLKVAIKAKSALAPQQVNAEFIAFRNFYCSRRVG